MRHSLPNARIMVHQPSGGAQGQATDIQIQAEEILKLKRQINRIYVKHTAQEQSIVGKVFVESSCFCTKLILSWIQIKSERRL